MPKKHLMTWVPSGRRWRKVFKGKAYVVSCRQLGVSETKEASWKAANQWWERQLTTLNAPDDGDRVARATRISNLVRDFSQLDESARREAVEALLGAGAYDQLSEQAEQMLASVDDVPPERTIEAQIKAWESLLHSVCQTGQMSVGRYDAYCRNMKTFKEWMGAVASIDEINEAKVEAFFTHLSRKVASEDYSPIYAHNIMLTAKQFIRRLAELRLIALPSNLQSARFRFKHTAAKKVETYTTQEVQELLSRAPEKMQLYLLLMLNCGMYQSDIADLAQEEFNREAGTITRARSKTRERGGPTVTYKLWPRTLELLEKNRTEGERVLTTERGTPLVSHRLVEGKMIRTDAIRLAWRRMKGGRLPMKHLRKTGATLLGQHPQYKYYSAYYLADSPKGMDQKHYVVPSEAEFFEALEWLGKKILG